MTPPGIEPAIFRFVAHHLNHFATAVPTIYIIYAYIIKYISNIYIFNLFYSVTVNVYSLEQDNLKCLYFPVSTFIQNEKYELFKPAYFKHFHVWLKNNAQMDFFVFYTKYVLK